MAAMVVGASGIGLGLGGCGSTSHASSPPTSGLGKRNSTPFLGDGDYDIGDGEADNNRDTDRDAPFDYYYRSNESWNKGYFHDRDDTEKLTFGRRVYGAEAQAISRVVTRYYVIATKDNGRRACAMLQPTVAQIVADYPRNGIPYLRHSHTCPASMDRLFRHYHLTVPQITDVRARGNAALVLWGSRTMPAGYIYLERSHGTWVITSPVGETLL